MIIDQQLRKVVREVLKEKKHVFQTHRSWKTKEEAVRTFLRKNKAAASVIKEAKSKIKQLEKAIEVERRKIKSWGLNGHGNSIRSNTLFKRNGGVVDLEPVMPPSFESVMSRLASATKQSEVDQVLAELGIAWTTLKQ